MMKYRMPFKTLGDLYGSTANRPHPHRGLDFPTKPGARIRSVSAGIVADSGWSDTLGFYIIVKDEVGIYWGYNHMKTISKLTRLCKVRKGSSLGFTGATGSASNGIHLHLTASHEPKGNFAGATLDPLKVLRG
jgi:murein DD-endopeptidase MepM/ murein hydrolase activator NlpD